MKWTSKVDKKKLAKRVVRDAYIVRLYKKGWSMADIAGLVNLTRQMVHLIIRKYEKSS